MEYKIIDIDAGIELMNSMINNNTTLSEVNSIIKTLPAQGMTIEKQMKRLLMQYSRWVREENKKQMKIKFDTIWDLYSKNINDISPETTKLIFHISHNHVIKKTYGSEYSRQCYNAEARILTRQEEIHD